jgi:hypothetical protein
MEADLADSDRFGAEAPQEQERWRKVIALTGAKAD